MRQKTFILVAAALIAVHAQAQRKDFLSRSELVLTGGGMNYIGDLNGQSLFSPPRPAGGAGLRYTVDNRWAVRLTAAYGAITSGDEDCIPLRNLRFRSEVLEVSAVAEFTFAALGTGPKERRWSPYIFGGLAVFHFNPMTDVPDGNGGVRWVELQPLGTEGQNLPAYPDRKPYRLSQLCLPFGVGVKWKLNKTFTFTAEYGLRKTWTDYLDDVSTTYVGSAALLGTPGDGALAAQVADRSGEVEAGYANAPGIKRGDDSLDDMYAFFHLTLGISLETVFGWMRSKRCRN